MTLSYADQVGPTAQKAVQAGIPTVAFNSGIGEYSKYDIGMYFGSDEDLAGQTAGQKMTAAGGGKTLCVVQEQGSVALEARCAGVKATFPNTENLNVNGTDLPSVQQTIQAKLAQDPSITWVVTLSAPVALAALQGRQQGGSQAKIVTFDLNADVAKDIQKGSIVFSIDQQPYVQGFMAVQSLWLNLTNGNDIGGGKPVLTGPSFDVDLDAGRMVIRRNLQRPKWAHGCDGTCGLRAGSCPRRRNLHAVVAETKPRAGRRVIGLPAPLVELLRQHRAHQEGERAAAGQLWDDSDWVFASPVGAPIHHRTDAKHWKDLLREAHVRDVRLHDARHTAATVLLLLGVPERTAMALMGWSNSSMAKRYQHVTGTIRTDVAAQVGGLLWPRNETRTETTGDQADNGPES